MYTQKLPSGLFNVSNGTFLSECGDFVHRMKAMLFAAGLGTRLRPLTNDRPKALVEVAGISLLERNLRKLAAAGFTDIMVNVHYFADMVVDFIEAIQVPAAKLYISDERNQLLETGGGLLKVKDFFADAPFLVHNVDILSDLDLLALMQQHQDDERLATLCVRQRATSRYLLFDRNSQQLVGWKNSKSGELRASRDFQSKQVTELAFSGIYVLDPAIFNYMEQKNGQKFSIIDTLLAAATTERILAYPHQHSRWIDVGKPSSLALAEQLYDK